MLAVRHIQKYLNYWLLLIALAIGVSAIAWIVHSKDLEMRQALEKNAEAIELNLNWENIYEGIRLVDQSDRSDYARLAINQNRAQMANLCAKIDKCRSLYLMQLNKKSQVYFTLDSSSESSEFFVAPGTIYNEATNKLLSAFQSKKVVIDDPAKDRWGYWVSAFAPHIMPDGSTMVAGYDVEASSWTQKLWSAAIVPLLTILAFLGLLILYNIMWQTKSKQNKHLLAIQEELFNLSNEDSLTKLPNRRLFEDRLAQLLNSAHRTNQKFTLISLDIDGFKQINDTYGHQAGDQLLITIADRLSMICRMEDTAARLSGDEFALLLPRVDNMVDAALVAQKIIDAVAVPITLLEGKVDVTASLGIVIYAEAYASSYQLVRAGDKAMYEAKNNGKNRFCFAKENTQTYVKSEQGQ